MKGMRNSAWRGSVLSTLIVTVLVSACLVPANQSEKPVPDRGLRFSEVVAFGDEYTDAGTYNPTTGDADPRNDVQSGMSFTTSPGTTWAVFVAEKLGLSLTSDRRVDFGVVGRGGAVVPLGGTDYAEGGALIDQPSGNGIQMHQVPGLGVVPVQGPTKRSIQHQVDTYLIEHGGRFGDRQLVLIQGGANELLGFLRGVGSGLVGASREHDIANHAADSMVQEILRIRDTGARQIVYSNQMDLGVTPEFRGTKLAKLATRITFDYNEAVAAALRGTEIRIFDTAALLSKMLASPASFGFSNTTSPACATVTAGDVTGIPALICSMQTLVTPGADQYYLFADLIRPSSRAHEIWGARVVQMVLNAE